MEYILYFLKYTVLVFILVMEGLMIIRVLAQLFDRTASGKLTQFSIRFTEPLCFPYRLLFHKLNWFQQTPLDVAFLFTWITLSILETVIINLF